MRRAEARRFLYSFCILNYSGSKFIKYNLYKIRIKSEKIVSETEQTLV